MNRRGPMRRRKQLIAIFAALFVLQTPLCALACVPGGGPTPMSAAAHDAPSCHETTSATTTSRTAPPTPRTTPEATPEADPVGPVDAHDACGCDESVAAVPSSVEASNPTGFELTGVAADLTARRLDVGIRRVTRVPPRETDLPPPDILSLQSTLLL